MNTKDTEEQPVKAEEELSPNISFVTELQDLLNKYSKENDSNTPDFILAEYLAGCLTSYNLASQQRHNWFSK